MAIFWTNSEISFNGSKQVPKWTSLVEKKCKISQKQKSFIISQINSSKSCFCRMSAVELVKVKIWFAHPKALEMRVRKLVLGLSVAQILPEKINNMFLTRKAWINWCVVTVTVYEVNTDVWLVMILIYFHNHNKQEWKCNGKPEKLYCRPNKKLVFYPLQ